MLRRLSSQRGATTVEYVVLLTFVVVPSIALFVLCFARVYLWYAGFTSAVSEATP